MSRQSRIRLLGHTHASMAPSMRPTLERGAWTFTAGLAIDADGAPHAYALPGSGLIGLDLIANAGTPGHWYGLACDNSGVPYVQGSQDPAPGYAVSTTALYDVSCAIGNPRRYVDASTIPYVVTPAELYRKDGVRMGDLAVVLRYDRVCYAIVADVGPHGHYGEASMACARQLGIDDSPRSGGVGGGVTYIIFPGSRSSPAWPRSALEFSAAAARRFADWKASAP